MSFIQEGINYTVSLFSGLVNKIIIAVIILLVGFILAKLLSKLTHRALKETNISKILKEISGIKIKVEEIVSHIILYFIYFISLIMALKHIGIATDILNIISGVIIVMIAIFILLSVKDFIPNIISGIIIHQKSTFKIGEIIQMDDITGKITEMTLLDTKLETKKKDIIIIPNSTLTKKEIIKKKKL